MESYKREQYSGDLIQNYRGISGLADSAWEKIIAITVEVSKPTNNGVTTDRLSSRAITFMAFVVAVLGKDTEKMTETQIREAAAQAKHMLAPDVAEV